MCIRDRPYRILTAVIQYKDDKDPNRYRDFIFVNTATEAKMHEDFNNTKRYSGPGQAVSDVYEEIDAVRNSMISSLNKVGELQKKIEVTFLKQNLTFNVTSINLVDRETTRNWFGGEYDLFVSAGLTFRTVYGLSLIHI
eukprot:TRINITY_DN19224_c0_g1_i1.p1 TRINITY_DN19224_c0_g1~~TRINITY_DN19224_c0_g1_i1.p1  ORF type:complete len:158 (-),score=28.64 TRINITY_DN19224_c0_g1_i1:60-476(-)